MEKKLLTENDLDEITTLSRTTRYRMRQEGLFPQPISISKRRVAYRANEIEDWIEKFSAKYVKTSSSQAKTGGLS